MIYLKHYSIYAYIQMSWLLTSLHPVGSGSRHEPVVVAPSKEPLNIW